MKGKKLGLKIVFDLSSWPEKVPIRENTQQREPSYTYIINNWNLTKSILNKKSPYTYKPSRYQLKKRRDILTQHLLFIKEFLENLLPSQKEYLKIFKIIINPSLETYAKCNIQEKRVYLHPTFFNLNSEKQIKILYHELISHIAKRIKDEQKALEDTLFTFKINLSKEKIERVADLTLKEITADFIVKCLENKGIEYVFGIPGEEILYLMNALHKSNIKFILTADERGAAFMANVYGRLMRKPAVCLTTLGPGATNAATGVADAYLDKVPMLIISGQSSTKLKPQGTHQRLRLTEFFKPITKLVTQVEEANIFHLHSVIEEAFKAITTMPQGPAFISIPKDIAAENIKEENEFVFLQKKKEVKIYEPSQHNLQEVAEIIKNARCPVVICGYEPLRRDMGESATSIAKFVKKHNLPTTTTFMGKGIISPDYEWLLPPLNSYKDDSATFIRENADLIITIGYNTTECSSRIWNPKGKKTIINIDYAPTIGQGTFRPKKYLIGDVRIVLSKLSNLLGNYRAIESINKENIEKIKEIRTLYNQILDSSLKDKSFPMNPFRIIKEMRESMNKEAILILDVGKHKMLWGSYFPVLAPSTMVIFNGLASMGSALPGAIGAKLAFPYKDVVVVCGDGGFMMSASELRTASQFRIPITVIVIDDGGLGLITEKGYKIFGKKGAFGTRFRGLYDLAKIAHGFGAEAKYINNPDSFKPSFQNALSMARLKKMPYVLIVPVNYNKFIELSNSNRFTH